MMGTNACAIFVSVPLKKDPKNKKDMQELNILHIFNIIRGRWKTIS